MTVFNIADFGGAPALPDNRPALCAATDAAIACGGGQVVIGPGTWNFAAGGVPIRGAFYVQYVGCGVGVTRLMTPGGTFFDWGDGSTIVAYLGVRDLTIQGPGTHIAASLAQGITTERVLHRNPTVAVSLTQTVIARLRDSEIRDAEAGGTGIRIDGGGDHYISGLVMDKGSGDQPAYGIDILGTGGSQIAGCDIIHSGVPLRIAPATTKIAWDVLVTDTWLDTSAGDGCVVCPSGTGSVINLRLKGVRFGQCQDGMLIDGSAESTIEGIELSGCTSVLNRGNGLTLKRGKDVVVEGMLATCNNTLDAATGYGISVYPGVNEFSITRNRAGAAWPGFGTNRQRWGVVLHGANTAYRVQDNNLRGNVVGGFYDPNTTTDKVTGGNLV